jgi:hypothetical protein
VAVLELSRAKGHEVEQEGVAPEALFDDRRPGAQLLALFAVTLSRERRLLLLRLQGCHLGLVGAQNPVEEVDHLGWIQQGIEAVVGLQLQKLAELLGGSVAVALKKLGNPEHTVGLSDLAF